MPIKNKLNNKHKKPFAYFSDKVMSRIEEGTMDWVRNDNESINEKLSLPANKEWVSSEYSYNKISSKLSLPGKKRVDSLIKNYFDLSKLKKGKKSKCVEVRLRRLSPNKIYVSKSEIKYSNNKVIVTIYTYNREKKFLSLKINRLFTNSLNKRGEEGKNNKINRKSRTNTKQTTKIKTLILNTNWWDIATTILIIVDMKFIPGAFARILEIHCLLPLIGASTACFLLYFNQVKLGNYNITWKKLLKVFISCFASILGLSYLSDWTIDNETTKDIVKGLVYLVTVLSPQYIFAGSGIGFLGNFLASPIYCMDGSGGSSSNLGNTGNPGGGSNIAGSSSNSGGGSNIASSSSNPGNTSSSTLGSQFGQTNLSYLPTEESLTAKHTARLNKLSGFQRDLTKDMRVFRETYNIDTCLDADGVPSFKGCKPLRNGPPITPERAKERFEEICLAFTNAQIAHHEEYIAFYKHKEEWGAKPDNLAISLRRTIEGVENRETNFKRECLAKRDTSE